MNRSSKLSILAAAAGRTAPALALSLLWFLMVAAASHAQFVCRGDVDGNGMVNADDYGLLTVLIFDFASGDARERVTADVNADGVVSAADLVGIALLDGVVCPPGFPTSTPTPTRTTTSPPTPGPGTPGATPTPTRTLGPTVPPSEACVSQPLGVAGAQGTIGASDCDLIFRQEPRRAVEYTFVGQADQAFRVDVTSSAFSPWVRVIDPNGYFVAADGPPPVEVHATTDLPYTILVTSEPGTPTEFGNFAVSLSTRPCTTRPLATGNYSLDGSECPAPSFPSFAGDTEYADIYTLDITTPLTIVSITMRQSREDSLLDPVLRVYGPSGYEVFPAFQADDLDLGGFGFDAWARFAAVETGRYTVVATGDRCDPQDEFGCNYRLIVSVSQCPRTNLTNIPDSVRQGREGILWGDPGRTRCAAPLPIPGLDEELGIPEITSPADFYTFQAQAGDIITVEMESEDEAQLYIFGPADAGNPLVAFDADSSGDIVARIGATLPRAGQYTIVAANKNHLFAPDPFDPEDEGDYIEYQLFLQKCGVRGAIIPGPTALRNDTLTVTDCVDAEDAPMRSYAVQLDAGTFLDATMQAANFDAYLTLVGPDGSRFANDDDPFGDETRNARVNRLAPLSGDYFLEARVSPLAILGAGPWSFTLRPRTCATRAVGTGTIDGSLDEGDCDLGDGRRYDVVTFDAPVDPVAQPRIASVAPSADLCVRPVLPFSTPEFPVVCDRRAVEVPVVRSGRHAWMLVGPTAARRGAYAVDFTQCAATPLGFGDAMTGVLQQADCADALGVPADWFVFRGDAGFVHFGEGVEGLLRATFQPRFSLLGARGGELIGADFYVEPERLHRSGRDLLAGLKLSGEGPADLGAYDFHLPVPLRLQ